ncbi:MAG: DNA-3-methyladenine glycosylase [Candidatus Microsaccharimonas sossegonensis]|uniref:Putative 3-methyladenine DNA glycosylase n=1 Tax=Candidatus Microsaccharimonas sossegonensis TaxID=2506948 RepID=A0A4V1J7H1_9BACT|nr:MAG: DNA-3-methyladenine glycosylase [Candidatus Microsaccharimonas sossegonensis]
MTTDNFDFLNKSAEHAAKRLLGCILERQLGDEIVRVKIIETEAYDGTDAASHSYKRRTPRTDIMFGPAGHLYVYFTYGMHYCCNIVVGHEDVGAAVLIRAVEPIDGEATMMTFRRKTGVLLTNGPAKLCQALSIDKQLNGHSLRHSPLKLIITPPIDPSQMQKSSRIGISRAKEKKWRFYMKDNPYVSSGQKQ